MRLFTTLLALVATRKAAIEEGVVEPLIEGDELEQEETNVLKFMHGLPSGERVEFLKRLNAPHYESPVIKAALIATEASVAIQEHVAFKECPTGARYISIEAECQYEQIRLRLKYMQKKEWNQGDEPRCKSILGMVYFNSDAPTQTIKGEEPSLICAQFFSETKQLQALSTDEYGNTFWRSTKPLSLDAIPADSMIMLPARLIPYRQPLHSVYGLDDGAVYLVCEECLCPALTSRL